MFRKYAKLETSVLNTYTANYSGIPLTKIAEFDKFRTSDSYLYARIKAISSRVNLNFDSWPSAELAGSPQILHQHQSSDGPFVINSSRSMKYGFSTFLGKPIFVDHNNHNPNRTRGVIVDSKLHVEDFKVASLDPFYSSAEAESYHLPPTWVELLLEIDAQSFPRFAKAIKEGAEDPSKGIDGFSMGANLQKSACNICHNVAEDESQFCIHMLCKGARFDAIDSKTGRKISKKACEKCLSFSFFEISAIPNPSFPADDTAVIQGIVMAKKRMAKKANNYYPGYDDPYHHEQEPEQSYTADDGPWTARWQGGPYADIYHAEYPDSPIEALNMYDYEKGAPLPADQFVPRFKEWTAQQGPEYQRQLPYMASKSSRQSWNDKMKVASFMKGSPEPNQDKYFGGKPGAAKAAYDSMIKEYGTDKGEEVFFATLNKHKSEHKSFLDNRNSCPECGSLLDPDHKNCPNCSWTPDVKFDPRKQV